MKQFAAVVFASSVLFLLCAVHVESVNRHPIHVKTPNANLIIDVKAAPQPESSFSSESSRSSESSSESSESSHSASSESSSESGSRSSESSSESGSRSESSSEGSSKSSSDLGFKLPPEPAAAKGYTPRLSDDEEDNSSNNDESNNNGCVENCEAEHVSSVGAKVVIGSSSFSQPLGDSNNQFFRVVPNTQTRAEPSKGLPMDVFVASERARFPPRPAAVQTETIAATPVCGCSVCPCQTQVTIPASPAIALPSSLPTSLPTNCIDEACLTPEQKKLREKELKAQQELQQREVEKERLHKEVMKHQNNLDSIEAMMRALKYQYSQLRRNHELLRLHVSVNKHALDKISTPDEYDLELEELKNQKPISPDLENKVDNLQSRQKAALEKAQNDAEKTISEFLDSKTKTQAK